MEVESGVKGLEVRWLAGLREQINDFRPRHTFFPRAGSSLGGGRLHALHLQGRVCCSAQAVLGSTPISPAWGSGKMPQAASQCLVLSID